MLAATLFGVILFGHSLASCSARCAPQIDTHAALPVLGDGPPTRKIADTTYNHLGTGKQVRYLAVSTHSPSSTVPSPRAHDLAPITGTIPQTEEKGQHLCPLLLHFYLPRCWRACDPAGVLIHSGSERVAPAGASGARCQPGCMRRDCVLSSLLLSLPSRSLLSAALYRYYARPIRCPLPLPPLPCPQLLPVLVVPSPKVLACLDEEWFRRSETRRDSLLVLFLPALSPHAPFFFFCLLPLPPLFFCDTTL
ncbi:hypothetical protein B0H13DRAFT_2322465 [Mycena leptocephala]|nr:hypothetical protein B0H13DRAFT_2322465 [Mycena leptocephala]